MANVADPTERIRHLRAEILRHDELYYRKAQSEISDSEYDALKNELLVLTEQFPEETARLGPSPAGAFGDDRSPGFAPARHRVRMLSLDKVHSEGALREFCSRMDRSVGGQKPAYVIEPKFDGLGISATYEQGRLIRVATRGDGTEGDDVTLNARQIAALPVELRIGAGTNAPELIEIRGEVFLTFAEFDRLNREREEAGEVAYASPRNLAVATLKSSEPRSSGRPKLEVVFYGVGAFEPDSLAPGSQSALLRQFRAWNLPTIEIPLQADTTDAVWRAVQEIGRARGDFPFPTDGAVIKLDSATAQRELGMTNRAPRWAVAYKFAPERAVTKLKSITVQVGRTGVLTPVAELEPVRLGGASISRATLHNASEIARRDIRIGDHVLVERTGEVIPAVVGVDLTSRDAGSVPFAFPADCPSCRSAAVRRDGEIAWYCRNPSCPAQLRRRLLHFASGACVGIKGLREGMIDQLVEHGLVHEIPDLYRLRREELISLGLTKQKSSDTLLAAIAATKHAELWRFISGFGIPGVGPAGARALAAHFGSLEALAGATEVELLAIEILGAGNARAVAAYFAGDSTRKMLVELKSLGVVPNAGGVGEGGPLVGKVFVLTGTFSTLSRARAVGLIEAAGGKVADAVTRRTSFVVAGNEPGAKVARAKELGVPVIDETGLHRMLDERVGE